MHIHIGGGGTKIGDFLWRLYEKEKPDVQKLNYIYSEDSNGNYCPNVLFTDLDYESIDQIKKKKYNNFKDKSFVNGKEDACDNYCKAHYTLGREIIDKSLDSIRQQIETMDYFDQFIITSSISGGTGSGFGSLLLERLSCEYGKKSKNAFLIYPSINQSSNVVDTYNAVLSTHMTLEHCDSVVLFDNESIYKILDYYLELDFINYEEVNNLISQIISSYTGLQRFNNFNNQLIFNHLIPYPKLHYITPSYGPLISINDYQQNENNENKILKQIINKDLKLYQCKEEPQILCSALINRQKDINHFYGKYSNSLQNLSQYFQSQTMVTQCQSKNYQILPEIKELKQTNSFLSHDAIVINRFNDLGHKYDILYEKRSFVHWFVSEGSDEGELRECRHDLEELCNIYEIYRQP